MGMMGKKGGASKIRVKGGMAAMLDFNASDIPDFAADTSAAQTPTSGKADIFSLFGPPSKKDGASDDDDEDDLAAALAKKLDGFEPKETSSDAESEPGSDSDAQEETDEKDDLLASLNALGGSADATSEPGSDEDDKADDDGSKDDLLASLNALGGGDDADAEKDDLLASLAALGGGEVSDRESGSEDDRGSDVASEEAASEGNPPQDSPRSSDGDVPLLTQYGSHGDINVNGLKRAKKTVQMKGLKSGGAQYQMEDDWDVFYPYEGSNDRALFCVFDGHAGKDAAAAAKDKFPSIFANLVDDAITDDENPDLSEEFKKAFLQTDEAMKDYEYEGCTATTVYLWRQGGSRFLQSANVGDSSAVLVHDGTATMISFDHRPTNAQEVERIRAMGIPMNPGQTRLNGLAVSRALGDHFPKSVECGIIAEPFVSALVQLDAMHSHLIVASDGVWDVVSPQRAYDLIRNEEDAEEAAKLLIKTVTKSAKCTDNVSCIVVRL